MITNLVLIFMIFFEMAHTNANDPSAAALGITIVMLFAKKKHRFVAGISFIIAGVLVAFMRYPMAWEMSIVYAVLAIDSLGIYFKQRKEA